MDNIVHLELYTEYSIDFGITDIDQVLDAAKKDGQTALAITDHHNIFAWVKFYRKALKLGIKPICGIRINIYKSECSVLLLCANQTGYQQLLKHLSMSYITGLKGSWPLEWLNPDNIPGLWVIALPKKEYSSNYEKTVLQLAANIGKQLVLGIHKVNKSDEIMLCFQYNLAKKISASVVALHPICFLRPDDFDAHEIRVCIQTGQHIDDPTRPLVYQQEQHWLSSMQMKELFKDNTNALSNAKYIADHCNVVLEMGVYHLPQIASQKNLSLKEYILVLTQEGMSRRYQKKKHNYSKEEYDNRLKYEIDVIDSMGFVSYFLIVSDFIQWAKSQDIPVGPGRGSGAGSLVSYALGITDLDPLEYNLLFERFLNPERLSMPDFDIDFCIADRDKVIQYVQARYGKNCVSQIITYGTMAAKAVVRDVGRVLGHPYPMVDSIAKLIPFELGITLDKALEIETVLRDRYNKEEEIKQLIDLAKSLEGKVRNVGRHAGGVVIAPEPLWHFSPLYFDDSTSLPMTQFDKNDLELIGLVKFDFLGLKTLTMIRSVLNILKSHGIYIDLEALDIEDASTYQSLSAGHTLGVFQLESSGMTDLVTRLKPDCLEDLTALLALYRPGPLQSGMVDDFIYRKQGKEKVEYPHPLCEAILKPTYGVIVYQEQVMQIAQVVASYTLGSADLLRRAMGKKDADEMASQRSTFVTGAKEQGLSENSAIDLFDLIEKFAGYGFNKSHSAAYALISYQTAYLKTHYPDAFMAALLSSEIENQDKIVIYARELLNMSLELLPPCVFASEVYFSVPKKNTVRYGLAAIKGVGVEIAKKITNDQELKSLKHYSAWLDCAIRKYKISRKTVESLVKAGAMDVLHQDRGSLMASVELYFSTNNERRDNDLFKMFGVDAPTDWLVYKPWPKIKELIFEQEMLGWNLNMHPVSLYKQEASALGALPLSALSQDSKWVVAVFKSARSIVTRGGRRARFWLIEDDKNSIELGLFDDKITKYRQYENNFMPLLMRVMVRNRDTVRRYILEEVITFEEIRKLQPPEVRIILPIDLTEELINNLCKILDKYKGLSSVYWFWKKHNISWSYTSVTVSEEFLQDLEMSGCSYELRYKTVI